MEKHVRKIIFPQYLCKPNVSPVQQIRSKNKYFVFYWQTQVFDEEKVNHYMNNLYKQMLLSNLFSFFATASKVSRCLVAEEGAVESRWCSLYQMSKNYKCCIKE